MIIWNNLSLYLIWLLLITICYYDIRYRIISNRQVMVIFAIILLNVLLANGEFNYISALIFLFIGMFLFYCNFVGAGDIKLISVLFLSLANKEIWDYLIIMALLGIPLALMALIKKALTKSKVTIPYGVAISLSYVVITSQFLILTQ